MKKVGEHITLDFLGVKQDYSPKFYNKIIYKIAKKAKVEILEFDKKNSFPSCVLHFKKPDNHAPQRHRIHLCRGSLAEAEAATPTQSVLAEWLFASSSPSSSSTTTTTPNISVPLSFASSPTQESCFF